MTRFTTMFLMSLALFTGACDDDADDAPAAGESAEVEGGREGRHGGKFARLDADKDGAITLAEAKGSRLEGKFAGLDADKDGKLTREEMKAMRRHGGAHKDPAKRAEMLLGKLDADKDGALSRAELAAKFGGEHKAKFAEKFAERFAAADTNADGKLSREELAASKGGHGGRGFHKDPGERAEMMLGKLDADKDGAISKAEMEAKFKEHAAKRAEKFAEKFTQADTDADGKLNRDELTAMKFGHGKRHGGRGFHKDPAKRAEMLFGRLDADKDGAISKSEVDGTRFAAKFAAVDANGDTRVTREELIAFRGERGERRGR